MGLKKEVKTISELANIRIPEDELENFADEFGEILAYMDKISTISLYEASDMKSAKYCTPLRKDERRIRLYKPLKLLKGKYYKVPKII